MAKEVYNGPLDKHMDFTNPIGTGIPAGGLAVQKYIKEIDSKKAGTGYTLEDGTAHLLFADEEDKQAYIADPTQTQLIVDRIELRSPYTMEVALIYPLTGYMAAFVGSTGNYISYSFTTYRESQVLREAVSVTYTITCRGESAVVTENYPFGTNVRFNIDDYIQEGINEISIEVTGMISKITAVQYVTAQVVNLVLTDNNDISTIYDNSQGNAYALFNYTVVGNGLKEMEWYVDGNKLPKVADEDEISQINPGQRWKSIDIGALSQGRHSIQFRVGMQVQGEMFYSPTLYREIIVSTGDVTGDPVAVVAVDLPLSAGVLGPEDAVSLYGMQYEQFVLRMAAWNPSYSGSHTAVIRIDNVEVASVNFVEETENNVPISLSTSGEKTLAITIGETVRSFDFEVAETSMNIHPITDALEFNFEADGRTNSSVNKDVWTDGAHTATFTGFRWTDTSGWVDGKLLIPSGASVAFDYAPLATDPALRGKTLEFEFQSVNVDDDNAVLCDLTNANGDGIKITATQIIAKSHGGQVLSRQYKSEENLRVAFIINPHTGPANSGKTFVFFNGIVSMGVDVGASDYYTSATQLVLGGTGAGMLLKQVRIYNTALDKDGILNNYILYRDTILQMKTLYDKNNLYEEGKTSFDIDKIANYLPVMIITGNIPAIENTNDKNLQITADIQYINKQDPTKSFTCKSAAMRGQGTTSMTYPRKNFRLYTNKLPETILYDYEGNVVESRKYQFKDNAQPVDCWCFKTDFAESSGTHNTGVARLWNDVIKRAQVDGQNVLLTEAQKQASLAGYPYDVRTTVDGFPFVIFYHLTEADNLIFLGKFNFNNDKSTESVFGFELPEEVGFDNSNVECWECLNSSNAIALFQTVEDWNTIVAYEKGKPVYGWMRAFEARYPDGSKDTTALYRLSQWLSSTYGADPDGDAAAQAKFAEWQTNKADYFDLYKLASYYIYLMRFGAVDQTVKNAMLTTEDGQHWFFILYDNDTINGVRNDGLLRYGPEIDRQSWDSELGIYCYAGHDSTLWNNFEADPECMQIARTIDEALYTAQLTYANVIDMFNIKQANKWAESIYNQDAQYKYINNPGYMGSMQGSRADHRKWWLSTRFALYDALFMSGSYKGVFINFLAPSAPAGIQFSLTSGKDFYYEYGLDSVPQGTPIYLQAGQSHTFTTQENFAIGTSVRIYAPYYVRGIDISNFISYIGAQNFEIGRAYSETLGTKLKSLIIGVDTDNDARRNTALTTISGLSNCVGLETLNVAGYQAMTALDLSALVNLTTFKAKASGLRSVTFASGAPLTSVELPSTLLGLTLHNLTELASENITVEGGLENINTLDIRNCSRISNTPDLLLNWLASRGGDFEGCSVYMDSIDWNDMAVADLITIGQALESMGQKDANGYVTGLRGQVNLASTTQSTAEELYRLFGPSSFVRGSVFFIDAPRAVYIVGDTYVLEGKTKQYNALVFFPYPGTVVFSLTGSRTGTSISSDGLLVTTETGEATAVVTVNVEFTPTVGPVVSATKSIVVQKRVYPTPGQVSIVGGNSLVVGNNAFAIAYSVPGVTGNMVAEWSLNGSVASYASIISQDVNGCVVSMPSVSGQYEIDGSITVVLKKVIDSSVVATITKSVPYIDDQIAVSALTNPYAMATLHNAGLSGSADYMTKEEAALVQESDLQSGTSESTSIFYADSDFRNNCTSFPEFQYFTRLRTVPTRLFHSCKLEEIILPSTITSISSYAFYMNTALASIVIPDSVLRLEEAAFSNCTNLSAVTLSSSLTFIGRNCFSDDKFTSLNLPSSLTTLDIYAFSRCGRLTSIEIPSGVTELPARSFASCWALQSITLPNTLEIIGNRCFDDCSHLSSITIPNSVNSMGANPFASCSSLSNISISPSHSYFYVIDNLLVRRSDDVVISAFGQVQLVPNTIKGFGAYSYNPKTLPSGFTIDSNIISIGEYAFGDYNLSSVFIPSSVVSFGIYIFYSGDMVTAEFENGCTQVPDYMFFSCIYLTQVILPATITTLGRSCFRGCFRLTTLSLPVGITEIPMGAFSDCGFTSFTIPSSVTSINQEAFNDCDSLVSLTVKAATPPQLGYKALYGCSSLAHIYVPYSSVNAYKTASGWSEFASIIEADPDTLL